jgi:hypothetical protein
MVQRSTALLMVCIGSLILLLALIILFHENANATKGYRLRSLEQERAQLHLENEILNMQIAQEQALENLAQDPLMQQMVPVKKPAFVDEDAPAIANPSPQSQG